MKAVTVKTEIRGILAKLQLPGVRLTSKECRIEFTPWRWRATRALPWSATRSACALRMLSPALTQRMADPGSNLEEVHAAVCSLPLAASTTQLPRAQARGNNRPRRRQPLWCRNKAMVINAFLSPSRSLRPFPRHHHLSLLDRRCLDARVCESRR